MRKRSNYIDSLRELTGILRLETEDIIRICDFSAEQRFFSKNSDELLHNADNLLRRIILNITRELILDIEKDDVAFIALQLRDIETLLLSFKSSILYASKASFQYKPLLSALSDSLNTLDDVFSMLSGVKKNSARINELCLTLTESLNEKQIELLKSATAQPVLIETIKSVKNIAERVIFAVLRVT
ncbi:MAG: hypothetical protein GX264_01790 [Clostridiales bacterium]|nr:hypothetical protein [Clostridiales bacterium]